MRTSTLFNEVWVSIGASRLRTFLAMLGIVIGVGSVVLMLAVGAGSRRAVQNAIDSLGSNLLIISPGNAEGKRVVTSFYYFDMKEVNAIGQLPSVLAAAPVSSSQTATIRAGKQTQSLQVVGTTSDFFTVRKWDFLEGAPFSTEDLKHNNNVAVLGLGAASRLFPGTSQAGYSLSINNMTFRIIGILTAKEQELGGGENDSIYIPITTAAIRFPGMSYLPGIVQRIYVQAASADDMDAATEDITRLLRARYKLRNADADNFSVRNLTSLMQVASDTAKAFSVLLGAIASISLVVGGIGIMNIMLVTVTERTREIGIRKAIGASEKNILMQFLMESVVISFIGSMIGLAISFGLGLSAQTYGHVPVEFSMASVILALSVAVVVGIASGLYPAYKAAKMQPIEALRAVNT